MAQSLKQFVQGWFSHTNKAERIWLMAKIEFKLRYYENKMGLIWALMKPISDMLVYYFAFSVVMHSDIPNFAIYLFIAVIMWNYFLECTMGTIQILQVKRYLYEYTNMDKLEIYLSVIFSNFIGFLFNFTIFLIFCLFSTVQIDYHIILIIPVFVTMMILSLGFSLILSNLFIIAKDISQIWMIVVGVSFWLSPIIYEMKFYYARLPYFNYFNPMAGLIINARRILMEHAQPDWKLVGFDLIYSLFFFLIGISLLKSLGPKASESL